MKIQQIHLKPGYCPFTDKKILRQEERGGQMTTIKNDNYSETWIQFETGEKMVVGIDKSVKMTKAKATKLVKAHVELWTKGIELSAEAKIKEIKKTRDKNLDYYSKVKLLKYAINEKSL